VYSIPTLLVGNKLDMATTRREVHADDARQLAMSWHAQYVETSAKDNQVQCPAGATMTSMQVDDIFDMLLYDIEAAHDTISGIDEEKRNCHLM
jgi:hypothetical protein